MTGLAVFLAAVALGLATSVWQVHEAAVMRGRRDAVRTGTWLTLSLGAYTGICLWLGFGWAAQALAALAAAVLAVPVVRSGRASIPAIPHNPAPVDRGGEADG